MLNPIEVARYLPAILLALLISPYANAQSLEGCRAVVPPPWEPVDFDADIQPIFDRSCVSCHQPGGLGFAQHQLDLRPSFAYGSLVNKPNVQDSAWPLVQPFIPDGPVGSLLFWKVTCMPPPVGDFMPPSQQSLTSPEIRALYIWMMRGAPPGEDGTGQLRAIEAGHSGTWYDPSLPGHGFSFEVLPGKPSRFIAFWMTFGLGSSEQQWLVGTGDFERGDATVDLDILRVQGGVFDFANLPTRNDFIGQALLTFSSCGEASMRYDIQIDREAHPEDPRQQRTVALRRLTPTQQCGADGHESTLP
jgi:hypothetical protein